MSNININRSVSDQFYRYKMPKLLAKVEGKGNGIKTVIVNMVEIAKALNRPPTYPCKYFGCELGAQTQFDFKNERFIVNGCHNSDNLQKLLDGFIKKFVLCPECENPETNLIVNQKKSLIAQQCTACGFQAQIDMRHKLTTFIVKNPPEQDPAAVGPTANKNQRKEQKSKKQAGKGGKNGDEKENGDGNEDSAQNEDDDDWGDDEFSPDALHQRQDELSDAVKKLAVTEELEKTEKERMDSFFELVKKYKDSNELGSADKIKEIVQQAEVLDIKDKAALVLVEVLFDAKILQQIKQYRNLFLRFTHESARAQRYMLGGLEQLIGKVYKEELMPKAAHIFQMLYEADILDEAVILQYIDKGPVKKYVSKEIAKEIQTVLAPFVKWLREAPEESDDEEDEDEVEVVYSNTPDVTLGKSAREVTKKDIVNGDVDDLDIDAI